MHAAGGAGARLARQSSARIDHRCWSWCWPCRSNDCRNTASRTAPTLASAPLPRPLAMAARASSRCTPMVSTAKSTIRRAPSAKRPGAPVGRAEHEAPLRGLEGGVQLPHLEDAHRGVGPGRHHREADVAAGRLLGVGPGDEPLEAFDRGRRRRDEARHFLGGQQRAQRPGVVGPQRPQRDARRPRAPAAAAASRWPSCRGRPGIPWPAAWRAGPRRRASSPLQAPPGRAGARRPRRGCSRGPRAAGRSSRPRPCSSPKS